MLNAGGVTSYKICLKSHGQLHILNELITKLPPLSFFVLCLYPDGKGGRHMDSVNDLLCQLNFSLLPMGITMISNQFLYEFFSEVSLYFLPSLLKLICV